MMLLGKASLGLANFNIMYLLAKATKGKVWVTLIHAKNRGTCLQRTCLSRGIDKPTSYSRGLATQYHRTT
jgi:hypothetical protein